MGDENEWLDQELEKKRKRKRSSRRDDSPSESESDDQEEKTSVPLKKRKADKNSSASEDEHSSGLEEFNDSYDEDLIRDDADRHHLNSLSEMDREQILNERYEKRKKGLERFELRKKLKNRGKRRVKTKKSGSSKALSEFAAKRKEKATRSSSRSKRSFDDVDDEEEEEEDHHQRSRHTDSSRQTRSRSSRSQRSSTYDDDEDSSKSEDDYDNRHRSSQPSEEYLPSLDELNALRISRSQLENWIYRPSLDTVLPGFFVRIGLGLGTGAKRVYRVAQINSVIEGPAQYDLGKHSTNLLLDLLHGNDKKTFRMEFVSNQQFTYSEYQKFLDTIKKECPKRLPSKKWISDKLIEMNEVKNYAYTSAEISSMVAQNKKKKGKPTNFAKERTELIGKLGEEDVDDDEREEVLIKIKELDELAKNSGNIKINDNWTSSANINNNSSDQKKPGFTVAEINKRNKERNLLGLTAANVEKKKRKVEQAVAEQQGGVQDIYLRARTMSSHVVTSKTVANDAPLPSQTNLPAAVVAAIPALPKNEKMDKKLNVASLASAHDIDINIDIDLSSSTPSNGATPLGLRRVAKPPNSAKPTETNVRHLSVNDYKRRRGLI